MKKIIKSKKLLITVVMIVVVLGLLTISVGVRNRKSTPSFVQRVGNDTMAIVSRVVSWPVSLVTNSSKSVSDLVNAENENDHLKTKVDDLAQTKARNNALESENAQLKAALKLKDTLTNYDIITGSVISRASDSWSDILIINRGSQSGVEKNMAVMSGGGVIGRILEANRTSSKVELLTSTDKSANRFAVEAESTNGKKVHGIISVTDDNQLAFTQVIDGAKLKKGTKVYTSGMGGRSPKGLLVGTVKKTTRDNFGLSDVIDITPAGNLNDPSVVSIVKREVSQ